MALFSRLIASTAAAFGVQRPEEDPTLVADEHLAATALLVHVAQADGVLAPKEQERLERIVRARYANSTEEARALIARATAFDAQTRDLSSIVELIGRDADLAERSRLVSLAWSVAGADGDLHEFEEALVWRLGKLLGLDETQIAQARTSNAEATL